MAERPNNITDMDHFLVGQPLYDTRNIKEIFGIYT